MNNVPCSDRSRQILEQYSQNQNIALALIENHNIDAIKLLDLLEQMRQNWAYERSRLRALEEELKEKDAETDGLRKEARLYKEQLRDARAEIAKLMSDRKGMEYDINELERKLDLVKDLLKDQSHVSEENRQILLQNDRVYSRSGTAINRTRNRSHGISRESSDGGDIDYDKTVDTANSSSDDLEESRLRNGKVYRRSRSMISSTGKRISLTSNKRPKKNEGIETVEEEAETPCKRSKEDEETLITTTAIVTVDAEGKKAPTAKVAVKRSLNRSISAANILDQTERTVTLTTNTSTPRCGFSSMDLCTPVKTKTWTRGATIETRPHTYANYSSLLGDHCEVCNGWIGWTGIVGKQAYKCCDCGIHVHKACVENAPVPCVPRTPTPLTPGKQRPRLKDYCPPVQPMIPPILIHCILALEKDRLSSEGIYRIPGNDTQVQKLLNELCSGRSVPKLEYHDTETITSCIKQFLNKLRDSVIPTTSWQEFAEAAEADNLEALNKAVMDLPFPNRDTLAFLCTHFQKVCDNSIRNRMPPNVLARCVAATIVGQAPSRAWKMDEEKKQVSIMLALLRMPRDYWPKFYNFDKGMPLIKSPHCFSDQKDKTLSKTPYKDLNKSILGPIETPPFEQERKIFHWQLSNRKRLLGDIF